MISAKRKMFATNKIEIHGLATAAAPAGHLGNLLVKLRKKVLGF